MCAGAGRPASINDALGMLDRALDYLATADAASLPSAAQADALQALERAESRHTATRARMLAAFVSQGGYEDDGHGTARTWLKWRTRVTHGAAAASVAWARRLTAHPGIAAALAAGDLSQSWARQICEWAGRLPEDRQADAGEILVAAARGGAGLAELGGLAQEMYERCSPGDRDDRFEDRWFRLGITFRGAGRAEGDLTPGCAAALAAVLEALGKKAGPEDSRTGAQRRHDALEEACRRLIRAGMVPARAGQPTQVLVHLTLAQLRGLPGAPVAEDAWAAARASQPGWLAGPDAEAALCDATIVPVVTGHVDQAALDQLASIFLTITTSPAAGPCPPNSPMGTGRRLTSPTARGPHPAGPAGPARAGPTTGPPGRRADPGEQASTGRRAGHAQRPGAPPGPPGRHADPGEQASTELTTGPPGRHADPGEQASTGRRAGHAQRPGASPGPQTGSRPGGGAAGDGAARGPGPGPGQLSPATRDRLRRALLGLAVGALSGPGGLAARLRAALDGGPLTSVSLPLDVGAATETIPAHLRRAVTARHPHCAFPGCDQPASVCDIHHIIPRSRGGPASLPNLVPLCGFHHLTAIHRWGWTLTLHSDGSTTALSPDGERTLHSHGPPGRSPPMNRPPSHGPPSHGAPGHSPPTNRPPSQAA